MIHYEPGLGHVQSGLRERSSSGGKHKEECFHGCPSVMVGVPKLGAVDAGEVGVEGLDFPATAAAPAPNAPAAARRIQTHL
jgi:hypothetical protein